MSKLNVLILGGSGFVGQELLKQLLSQVDYFKVYALQHINQIIFKEVELHKIDGSIRSLTYSRLKEINPDIVFHLARNNSSKGRLGRYIASLKGYYANKEFLKNLNQLNKPVGVIYLSGSLMYGEGTHPENGAIKPTSFARQYILAEAPFLIPQHYPNLNITMVRAPWILGDGSWFKTFYHQHIIQTQFIQCYSSNNFKMQFIAVEDCAANLINISKLKHKGVYNLFMPTTVTYAEFVNEVALAYGINNIRSYDNKWLNHQYEKAIYEAFTKETLMTTIYPEVQKEMVFPDSSTLEMLQRKLASFAHYK